MIKLSFFALNKNKSSYIVNKTKSRIFRYISGNVVIMSIKKTFLTVSKLTDFGNDSVLIITMWLTTGKF